MLIPHVLFLRHVLSCYSLMKLVPGTVQGADWRENCHLLPMKKKGLVLQQAKNK